MAEPVLGPRIEQCCERLLPCWPEWLARVGFALFAFAGIAGDRVPAEVIYAGPAMMLAGVILTVARGNR